MVEQRDQLGKVKGERSGLCGVKEEGASLDEGYIVRAFLLTTSKPAASSTLRRYFRSYRSPVALTHNVLYARPANLDYSGLSRTCEHLTSAEKTRKPGEPQAYS
jgi:hypothetical protein